LFERRCDEKPFLIETCSTIRYNLDKSRWQGFASNVETRCKMSEQQYEHYSMVIQWSIEDDAYLVTVPELPGCVTHGATYEEAARQGQDAIESWIDARRASGRAIPAPRVLVSSKS
jgi:predicted RNase H-like HicB family nuclease